MSVAPCPKCRRPNATFRATCLYCGAALPNPTQPPPDDVEPEDLEALVRAAMTGKGSIKSIRERLSQRGRKTAAPRPLPMGRPRPPARPASTEPTPHMPSASAPLEVLTPDAPAQPSSVDTARSAPQTSIQDVLSLLMGIEQSWKPGQWDAVARGLAEAQQKIGALQAEVERQQSIEQAQAQSPPVVDITLDPVEPVAEKTASEDGVFLLYVRCPGDPGAMDRVSRALGVDQDTARSIAVCRHPTEVRRASDRQWLEAMAERYRSGLGLDAAVISLAQLPAVRSPSAVLGATGVQGFRAATVPLWKDKTLGGRQHLREMLVPTVLLAVPGTIMITHYQASEQHHGHRMSHETRCEVLDLHGPGVFLRLMEDMTDFQGMPGHSRLSARRSMRGFLENITEWYPEAKQVGARVCRSLLPPASGQRGPLEMTGWDAWEEHSRLCRLMAGVAPK